MSAGWPFTDSPDYGTPDEAAEAIDTRLVPGGTFILDAPKGVPAVWGDGDQVAWSEGEPLLLVGPAGVGKTTLAGQLVMARLGLLGRVLGMPVVAGERVLYLACDRPPRPSGPWPAWSPRTTARSWTRG
jgi:hypothetical protein